MDAAFFQMENNSLYLRDTDKSDFFLNQFKRFMFRLVWNVKAYTF